MAEVTKTAAFDNDVDADVYINANAEYKEFEQEVWRVVPFVNT